MLTAAAAGDQVIQLGANLMGWTVKEQLAINNDYAVVVLQRCAPVMATEANAASSFGLLAQELQHLLAGWRVHG